MHTRVLNSNTVEKLSFEINRHYNTVVLCPQRRERNTLYQIKNNNKTMRMKTMRMFTAENHTERMYDEGIARKINS